MAKRSFPTDMAEDETDIGNQKKTKHHTPMSFSSQSINPSKRGGAFRGRTKWNREREVSPTNTVGSEGGHSNASALMAAASEAAKRRASGDRPTERASDTRTSSSAGELGTGRVPFDVPVALGA
jgi:hypothetical protein